MPTSTHRVARALHVLLRGLRLVRLPAARALSPKELAGSAFGLAYAIAATRWQRRAPTTDWPRVYRAWEARLPAPGEIDPGLWGQLQQDDRWELLTDNAGSFATRDRLYAQAQRSIDLATYYLQADATGWRTARALADAAQRGVRVRLVADGWATRHKAFAEPQVEDVLRFLRDAGVTVQVFEDARRPFDAAHRKLLLVDGQTLLIGGRNYADHYAGSAWRDVELLLTGPSVRGLEPLFEDLLAGSPQPIRRGVFHASTPAGIEDNAHFLYLLQCIRASRRTLDLENAYYFKHPPLHEALRAACARGVRVRLLTNSPESNDLDFMNFRLCAAFAPLIDAGVQLHLRRGKGRTLHGKYAVADGEWVSFGSSNLDFFSPRFCSELGLHLRDAGLAAGLTRWFEEGLAQSEPLTDRAAAQAMRDREGFARRFDRLFPDIQ